MVESVYAHQQFRAGRYATSAQVSLKVLCTRFGKCLVCKQGNFELADLRKN